MKYSTEERNKLLTMAMKQYECCGLPLKLDDYFSIKDYSLIYKISYANDNELRLFYSFVTNKMLNDNSDKNWFILSDEHLKKILTMSIKSHKDIRKRYNFYHNLKENFNISSILNDIKQILDNNHYPKLYKTKDLILYWNILDKVVYEDNKQNIDDIINLRHICANLAY